MTTHQNNLQQQLPLIRSIVDAAESRIYDATGLEVKLIIKPTESNIDEKEELINNCCITWGVTVDFVKKRSRNKERVAMRQILIFLLKMEYPKLALKDIAIMFRMKDHTSAIYAIKTAKKHLQTHDDFFMSFYTKLTPTKNANKI